MRFFKRNALCLLTIISLIIIPSHSNQEQFLKKIEIREVDLNNEQEINELSAFFSNAKIQKEANFTDENIRKYIERNKRWLKRNKPEKMNQIIIARKGKKICGVAISYLFNDNQCWLKTIIVKPCYRRQKIASTMLQTLEKNKLVKAMYYSTKTDNIAACQLIKNQQPTQFKYFLSMTKPVNDFSAYPDSIIPYTIHQLDSSNKQDVDKICELLNDEEMQSKLNSLGINNYQKYFTANYTQAIFAQNESGQLCGVLCYSIDDQNKICMTEGLAVHKDHRHQGIAKALIKTLQQNAQKNACNTICTSMLTDNTAAINCYRSAGFIEEPYQKMIAKKELPNN